MPIKPPESQDEPSGFDPGEASPPIRFGVFGDSQVGPGLLGSSGKPAGDGAQGGLESGAGVLGVNRAVKGIGVHGSCRSGTGVSGRGGGEGAGVAGTAESGPGVFGTSTGGPGVSGRGGGEEAGVAGTAESGPGVFGTSTGGPGVAGTGDQEAGVTGTSAAAPGVEGRSTDGPGLLGISEHNVGIRGVGGGDGSGVIGACTGSAPGVFGSSSDGSGVEGNADGEAAGVVGRSEAGPAVFGVSTVNVGVRGESGTGIAVTGEGQVGVLARGDTGLIAVGSFKAADFDGDVHVSGSITVTGSINKSACSFRIDHPLDPANRVLEHCSVESSERKNVYDGTVTLDGTGEATVTLPGWFAALNGRLCYQLTPLDGPAPELHVVRRGDGGSFDVRGGAPGAEVCWQVTGVRQDAWARANPLVAEQDKPSEQRGHFITPDAHGRPPGLSITGLLHRGLT
ncbi:hypothetical protein [Kitasatospora sp. NPDC050543]|uniref:hypothetical protein n=1 Tax=Kitasatospora sp. NPDC050543 TaxID=3364054 RepID=UPI0037A04685